MSELRGDPKTYAGETPAAQGPSPGKPVGVYLIALFFTAVWIFSLISVLYVILSKLSPGSRQQLLVSAAVLPLAIAQLNGLLTVVASWLLVAMRRVGAGLLLASTLLVLAMAALSWPGLLALHSSHPAAALLYPLLLGGSNLVLHIAATVYAFHLDRRGLLR